MLSCAIAVHWHQTGVRQGEQHIGHSQLDVGTGIMQLLLHPAAVGAWLVAAAFVEVALVLCQLMAAQLLHLQDPQSEPRFLRQANVHLAISEDGGRSASMWMG